jgi:hypothetical protein
MLHVRVDVPPIPAMLEALAEGLVLLDIELMRHADERGMQLPALYDSGVVYRREPSGREWWEQASDLMQIASDRSGDCEDLACYRVAELRYFEGEDGARARVLRTPRGSFHCVVERADGSIEDPSRELLAIESATTGIPMGDLAGRTTTDRRYT